MEFDIELKEYLAIKSKSTRKIYSSAYRTFLQYYQEKYGKDKNFTHSGLFDTFLPELFRM